ncbi:MAG: transaldolase, partial [Candidatus Dormibacteraceae bacterium]
MSARSEPRPAPAEAADPVLRKLLAAGQSPWLDNIRRELISSGRLARLRDDGLRGVTSNPTIFDKAVAGSSDYDQSLDRMARAGVPAEQALWDLMVEDIQAAADVFLPNWESTGGADGFVSIEVSPELAGDTEGTLAMVRDLHRRCARPNVMVKIPATKAGLPAIRRSLAEGININVTLIFSVERYVEVVDAFMSGLEDFHGAGGDLSQMASVASFFVSRVDTKVDKRIQPRLAAAGDAPEAEILRGLLGKIGIANSKLAYEKWAELHSGPRWEALAKAGARPQRCLWASTSTKDPSYPDTMYVDGLIGPDTVDTVPPETLRAFRDHGRVERSLDRDVHQAHQQIEALAAVGIDLREVTDELEQEGVAAFAKSFESLIATLTDSLDRIKRGEGPRQWQSLRGL